MEVEEGYTQELMVGDDREQELRKQVARLEDQVNILFLLRDIFPTWASTIPNCDLEYLAVLWSRSRNFWPELVLLAGAGSFGRSRCIEVLAPALGQLKE